MHKNRNLRFAVSREYTRINVHYLDQLMYTEQFISHHLADYGMPIRNSYLMAT